MDYRCQDRKEVGELRGYYGVVKYLGLDTSFHITPIIILTEQNRSGVIVRRCIQDNRVWQLAPSINFTIKFSTN
jgi:hypothetical protein